MLSLSLSLVSAALAAPADVELAFDASTQVVADLAWDRAPEDRLESWTRLRADAAGPAGRGRWKLGVYGEHQLLVGWPEAGGDVEAAWDLRPWASGWEGPVGPVRVKAGHLIERWGKLDLLPVTDVLMGRDLRAGLLTPADLVRQPAPLVRVQAGVDRARAELTVLPFGAADRIALEGTDYALIRQGQLAGALREASTWPGDALTTAQTQAAAAALAEGVDALDHSLRRGAFSALSQSGRPDPLLGSVDVAARLEAEPGRMDVAVVGAWLRSRQPLLVGPDGLADLLQEQRLPGVADAEDLTAALASPVAARWPRTGFAGVELAGTAGAFGLRAESAWRSHKPVPRAWLQGATRPAVAAGVGVDRAWGTSVLLVLEGRYERTFDLPADALLAVRDDWQVGLGGRVGLAGERVQVEPGAVGLLSFGEVGARLQATWRVTDAWELAGGGLLLLSDATAPRSLDEAIAFRGGPVGALGDTDAAWLTLRCIQ